MEGLAGAAVKAVVSSAIQTVATEVCKVMQKRMDLLEEFDINLNFIKRELNMMSAEDDIQLTGKGTASMEEMRDLALDMQDCLDRILRTTEGKEEASVNFAKVLKKLRKRIEAWHERKVNYKIDGITKSTTIASSPSFSPVGIDVPKNEIVELMTRDVVADRPKVISIVGFGGSGKTTLAKKVYDDDDVKKQFPYRAWVEASKHGNDTKALLTELFGKFCPEQEAGEDVNQLQTKISNYLSNKRHLIVLDDIKEEGLLNFTYIQSIFSNNTRSRIIVTTRLQTVANTCSLGNGHIYNMTTLDDKHSEEVLENILQNRCFGLQESSTSIVNKCDGHPLSLDNVARYLQKEAVISRRVCEDLSRRLGYRVETDSAFLKLREVLTNNYNSLPDDLRKVCFMYMCVFPNDCHVKRTRLMRRWSAEHYVQDTTDGRTALEAADEYFKNIVHQSIVNPIGTSKNRLVKSCRAHGIMHEFMLHVSQSAEFISSVDNPNIRNYRHLFRGGRLSTSSGRSSNQNHGQKNPTQSIKFAANKAKKTFGTIKTWFSKNKEGNKPRAHSLTICGNAGEAAGKFLNCELLRVLDMEECDDLKDEDIDGIHELWHLKYLSLGAKISKLPRAIEKLYCLETLDVRKTKKEIKLPVVVIQLPHLAHLFGKFKLEKKDWKKNKPENYVPKNSNLQTLAGFVIDDDPGFPLLMDHMKKLQKVKVWCNSDSKELLDAIKNFIQIGGTCHSDHSVSLYLGPLARNFVSSLSPENSRNPQPSLESESSPERENSRNPQPKAQDTVIQSGHHESSLERENSRNTQPKAEDTVIQSAHHESSPENTSKEVTYRLSSLKMHGSLGADDRVTQLTKSLAGLKVLCLSSTNHWTIDKDDLSNLGGLFCLEYLKLVKISLAGSVIEKDHFQGLLCLCLVQSPALPAEVKDGALRNLKSLQLLAKDLHDLAGIRIEQHKLLQEVALDSKVNKETQEILERAAKEHPNRPSVLYLDRVVPDEGTESTVKYVVPKRPAPETTGSS